jgi:hypothetical protein
MNKYNSEDYFSVIETKTGRKIVDCAEESDALLMVSFDPQNRTVTRNKILMSPVIDIEMPKALPTNAIDTVHYKEHQDNWMIEKLNELPQIKLPERQQEPFVA